MEVTSHIDHGTVNLNTPDGVKEFNVDELKKFHGDPCEGASRKVGGRGYDRKSGPETQIASIHITVEVPDKVY